MTLAHDTPDPIPQARESAVEVRPLPSRDELARMLDEQAFVDAQHPYDIDAIIRTDRVREAYKTADRLLTYFRHTQTAALASPSGDDVAELRAELARKEEWSRLRAEDIMTLGQQVAAAEAQRDALQERARAACFHYWHCGSDNGCGKVESSMAELAVAIGFDRESVVGDEIRAALTPHQQGNGGEGHGG